MPVKRRIFERTRHMRCAPCQRPRSLLCFALRDGSAPTGTKLIGSIPDMHDAIVDRQRIREVAENWVIWRDARDLERFRGFALEGE